jgi:hypothetical protein
LLELPLLLLLLSLALDPCYIGHTIRDQDFTSFTGLLLDLARPFRHNDRVAAS